MPAVISELRELVRSGDLDQLHSSAHRLKGSALNLGLPLVGEAAFDLEERGREGRLDGAGTAYDVLAREMDRALTALVDARAARV